MTIFKTKKQRERESINESILVLSKLLSSGYLTEDVIKAVNKKLEILTNEL